MRRLLAAPVLLLRGRRSVGPGETPLPYASALGLLAAVLLGAALVAVVVVAVVVPWAWLRTVLLLAGAAAALAVLASWCAAVVYPHVVGGGRLGLRQGATAWQDLPLGAVARAERAPRRWPRSGVLVAGDEVAYVVDGRTQVTVHLGEPVPLTVRRRPVAARAVHLSVDDPDAALAALREAFGQDPGA